MSRYLLLVLTFTACSQWGVAQTVDRLDTPECRNALDALRAQASTAAARTSLERRDPPVVSSQFEALRRQAAAACLGGRADLPPVRRQTVSPPVAVTSIGVPPLARPTAPPSLPPVAPARPIDRPTAVTSCDAAGCWANDGTRLQKAGPNLIGPRGVCTLNGSMLHCP